MRRERRRESSEAVDDRRTAVSPVSGQVRRQESTGRLTTGPHHVDSRGSLTRDVPGQRDMSRDVRGVQLEVLSMGEEGPAQRSAMDLHTRRVKAEEPPRDHAAEHPAPDKRGVPQSRPFATPMPRLDGIAAEAES